MYFTLDGLGIRRIIVRSRQTVVNGQSTAFSYTLGASLADGLLDGLEEAKTRFILKGQNKEREEMERSAAVTASNQSLFLAGDEVTVCGIASEFCVLETLKNVFRLSQEVGFDVNVFLKGTVGFDSTPLLEWMAGNGVKEY